MFFLQIPSHQRTIKEELIQRSKYNETDPQKSKFFNSKESSEKYSKKLVLLREMRNEFTNPELFELRDTRID
jgi:hypothetical protein